MTNHQPSQKRNVWEQWDWVWHVSAYSFLVLNTILYLRRDAPTVPIPLFLGISALLALWYIPFVAFSADHWRENVGGGVLHFIIGWGLLGAVLGQDAGSLLLVGMFFPMIFTRFPIRWAVVAAFSQTIVLYLLYAVFHFPENWFVLLMITVAFVVIASLMGAFIAALITQSLERQRLIDELTRTRASLLKVEREAGVLAERQRLAREIHDAIAQQFTSIIMHLAAARLGDPVAVQDRIQQAEQTAREGLDETRRMIWDMQPQALEQASLVESLEGVAARWSAENAVEVSVTLTGSPQPLNPSVDVALLRITQEALQNVKKHAQAQNVNITLSYMSDQIALDVADDGRGFDMTSDGQGSDPLVDGRGFGLNTMYERASELGGRLTVESEPGKGTAIAVSIPILEAT